VPGSAEDFASINAEGFAIISAGDFVITIAVVDSPFQTYRRCWKRTVRPCTDIVLTGVFL
jgi:hypothetical protein